MTGKRSNQSIASISNIRTSHGGSRSGGLFAVSSKRNVAFDTKLDKAVKKHMVQVFDDDGNDVTPKRLLNSDLTVANIGKMNSKTMINFNDSSSIGTPSELLNQSMYAASTVHASYAAGFSRSMISSMMGSSRASLDSVADEICEANYTTGFAGLQEIEHKRTEVKEVLFSSDLQKMINICLEETDTLWHLDTPGVYVNQDQEEVERVKERNRHYEKLCLARAGNDMFVQRGMQTFNNALKTKEIQTLPISHKDVGCMATVWDLYDTYNKKETVVEDDVGEDDLFVQTTQQQQQGINSTTPTTITGTNDRHSNNHSELLTESNASFLSVSSVQRHDTATELSLSGRSSQATQGDNANHEVLRILNSSSFKEHLFVMEKTVVQNLYQSRQAMYRGLEDLIFAPRASSENINVSAKLGPNISRLWSYDCQATKGLLANCMVWNKINYDLLAVGYGENNLSADGKGLVCVWSVKNPEHPERMFKVASAAVSIDFSTTHPNFLAVGLYNGSVAVFNIRHTTDACVLDNIGSLGKHGAPVWQLRWVERDKGSDEAKDEVLISSSADGRITQWSIRKGFEYLDLMRLKRMNTTTTKMKTTKKSNENSNKKSDALIWRYSAGMCFDFHKTDGNMYLAGTEEGLIHRCSCSYNEQYLETYVGHKGPIYRTLWSPFDNQVFLTCSDDWTVRLWHLDKQQPVLTFQASTDAILDVDWSPWSAVMFVAISKRHIQIWDLSVSIFVRERHKAETVSSILCTLLRDGDKENFVELHFPIFCKFSLWNSPHHTLDPLVTNLPVSKVDLTCVKFALSSEALLVGDSEGHVTIYQLREMNLNVSHQNSGWLSRVMDASTSQTTDDVIEDEEHEINQE